MSKPLPRNPFAVSSLKTLDEPTEAVLDFLYRSPPKLFRLLEPHWVTPAPFTPAIGALARFTSIDRAELGKRPVGVRIMRQLGPDEADAEVGPMFEVEAAEGEKQHAFAEELTAECHVPAAKLLEIVPPLLKRAGIGAEGVDWEALSAHPDLAGQALVEIKEDYRDEWRPRPSMSSEEIGEFLDAFVRPKIAKGADRPPGLWVFFPTTDPWLAIRDLRASVTPAFANVLSGMVLPHQGMALADNYYVELICRNDGSHALFAKYQTIIGSRMLGVVSDEQIAALHARFGPAADKADAVESASTKAAPQTVETPPVTAPAARIPADVLDVLRKGRTEDNRFYLPNERLDRKLYERTNAVLKDLGGAWKGGKTQAHVFEGPAEEAVATAVATGDYTKPSDFGFFPTPGDLADEAIALAGIGPGMRVLEPSGGRGALALRAAALVGAENVQVYEFLPGNVKALRDADLPNVTQADFLQVPPTPVYQAVVMNPPFGNLADVKHVEHAARFLAPDGVLVAIMSPGFTFRDTRAAREFKAFAEAAGAQVKPIPAGTFRESGTEVATVLVRMEARNFPWNQVQHEADDVEPDETEEETVAEAPRG